MQDSIFKRTKERDRETGRKGRERRSKGFGPKKVAEKLGRRK